MAAPTPRFERYTHGHHAAIVASHARRTAENSAGFLLDHLRPGQRLLDVGCGPGSITVDLAERVAPGPVLGIDREPAVLDGARALAAERALANVRFEPADVYALPYPEGSFDVVYAHQLLQHLVDPVAALVEMRRVLAPGGLLAVRDSDYATMIHAPHEPLLDRWLALYHEVARTNRAEADAGRHLKGWVLAAGFTDPTTTASTWWFTDSEGCRAWAELWAVRITEGAFAEQACHAGLSSTEELAQLAAAWRTWAARPDAFFAFLHGEVLARRDA
jgi:SAM-dependent methyltransferase